MKIAKSLIHKAKNTHRCSDCGTKINPGEEYRYIFGAKERQAFGLKLCRKCDPETCDQCEGHGVIWIEDMEEECGDCNGTGARE
jgi:hypothetical protein